MGVKTFEEQLDDLIDSWVEHGGDVAAVISALEMKLMGLKEEASERESQVD